MRTVLFATTALIATTSFAAAEISTSASAQAGIFGNDAAGTTVDVFSSVGIDFTFSGATDSGLTFGAGINADAGNEIDTGEVGSADDFFDGEDGGTFGHADIFISSEFGTITFDAEGIDNAYDDDISHDISFAYDIAGLSVLVTVDTSGESGEGEQFSANVGYSTDALGLPISVYVNGDDSEEFDLGGSVTALGTVTVSGEFQSTGGGDGEDAIINGGIAYDDGTFRASAAADTNDDVDVGAGFTSNGLSVDAAVDLPVGDQEDAEWEVTGTYDLGGGLALIGGISELSNFYLGATMAF